MFFNKIKSRNCGQEWFVASVIMLLAFSLSINGQVQNDSSTSKAKIPRNAFQFQIADNFQLTSFQGSVISMKRLLSEKRAIRFGLGITANINNDDSESSATMDSLISNRQLDYSSYGINISAQYLYSPYKVSGIVFFIGAGPLIGYSYAKSDDKNVYYQSAIGDTVTVKHVATAKNYGLGIVGVCGVEWFLKEKLSLTAEYGLSIQYSWRDSETNISQQSELGNNEKMDRTDNSNSFAIRPVAVRFGVSIYF
jgi:hypothetical protein